MNKVIILGVMAKEPEYKTLPSGSTFCKFVVRDYHKNKQGETEFDYFNCKAFGKTADFVGKFFTKDKPIAVVGKEITERWEQDGQKRYAQTVMVSDAEFVPGSVSDSSESEVDFR